MAEKRMIRRDIYESSVMANLAEKSPDLELEAQRIFTTLILMADDYGRGRMLPMVIRAKAFASTANAIGRVTIDNVREWITAIENQGAIEIYEVDGDRYYVMTGWNKYQDGKWYKKDSLLPPPPSENLGKTSEVSLESPMQVKLSKDKRRKDIMPPKPGGKRKDIPIEERAANTPTSRIVQQWHRKYLKRTDIHWTGDIKRMGGQTSRLLKSHTEDDLLCAMTWLLDQEATQYVVHEFDHFVKKASTYIGKAKKAGYFT